MFTLTIYSDRKKMCIRDSYFTTMLITDMVIIICNKLVAIYYSDNKVIFYCLLQSCIIKFCYANMRFHNSQVCSLNTQ